MISSKNVGAALFAMVAAGCATESSAFTHMSAVDHETAARGTGDSALAEAHATAAARLRDQERADCYGVSDTDRDLGPFARSSDVSGIQVVKDHGAFPKEPLHPVGVAVELRAESGVTQQWLGRVVACHLAHLAVVGGSKGRSPLGVPNTEVAVSSTAVGFRVTITSRDPDAARSVVERGRELAEASPTTIAWY